jgi:hypothetical protein
MRETFCTTNGHRGSRERLGPSAGLNHEDRGRFLTKLWYAPARQQQSVATQNSHRHEVAKSCMFRHCIIRSKIQELLLSAGALIYARLSAVSCQVTPLSVSRLQTERGRYSFISNLWGNGRVERKLWNSKWVNTL